MQLLITLPGVNYAVALGLLAALGDISHSEMAITPLRTWAWFPQRDSRPITATIGHITKAGNGNTRGC